MSCTELSIWEFPFLRGSCRQWGNSKCYCVNGMLQKETLKNVRTPVCFRILSTSCSSVSVFSVCCYSSVSISMRLLLSSTRKEIIQYRVPEFLSSLLKPPPPASECVSSPRTQVGGHTLTCEGGGGGTLCRRLDRNSGTLFSFIPFLLVLFPSLTGDISLKGTQE